jgi:ATP-dependent Clp protease ATP-binding subunit ClpB
MTIEQHAAKLNGLEPYLRSRIIGQEHVIPAVAELIRQAENHLTQAREPRCKLLFLGPTGVGKTETAKAISDYIFGEGKLHHLNMSQYQHIDAVKLLIGDDSGKIGALGEILDKYPGPKTVLFDECEKGHRNLIDLFLQILDEAVVDVGYNRRFDVSDCYIILTSNVGSAAIMNAKRTNPARLVSHCKQEFGKTFRPELIERFQDFAVFHKLLPEHQYQIAEIEIKKELAHLAEKNYTVSYTPDVVNFLYQIGYSKLYGARPMRQKVRSHIRAAVNNHFLRHLEKVDGELMVNAARSGLTLTVNKHQIKDNQ